MPVASPPAHGLVEVALGSPFDDRAAVLPSPELGEPAYGGLLERRQSVLRPGTTGC